MSHPPKSPVRKNPLGNEAMLRLETDLVGPVRRGARKAGVTVGKGLAVTLLFFALLMLSGGFAFKLGAEGILDAIGLVMIVLGSMGSAVGGTSLLALGRYRKAAENKEIVSHLHQMMTARGEVAADEVARNLRVDVQAVEAAARTLEGRGLLERDVRLQRGVEVYRPLGWKGTTNNPALDDPKHHSERRELEGFEQRLAEEGVVTHSVDETVEEEEELDV
ncbi:MAG: hypothetical protein AUK47_11500 [Deltaproteobacteria bacterium CG2_30_63_29]|nr:MAG: hypothetical protein AUK47_11500 [Deltaproteobacteria bacterium CG2_30_63_29]PJB49284.1 MAG: hypothetical protein CO108_00410 [Deltaproteobacteria bacterium CG_4_9_14_3_um_filter_63_12]